MKLYERLGWKEDPFDTSCILEADVRNKEDYKQILSLIKDNRRLILYTSEWGFGKTFTIDQITENPPENHAVVVYNSIVDKSETHFNKISWLAAKRIRDLDPYEIKTIEQPMLFGLFKRKVKEKVEKPVPVVDVNELADYIEKNLPEDMKLILIWDEIGRVDVDWVAFANRLLSKRKSYAIFTGIKKQIEERLSADKRFEASLKSRRYAKLEVRPWSKEELIKLVEKRIGWAGGQGTIPFSVDALEHLALISPTPRDMLENCRTVVGALNREYESLNSDTDFIPNIDSIYVETMFGAEKPTVKDALTGDLSSKELEIVEYLVARDPQSVKEISKEFKMSPSAIDTLLKRILEKTGDQVISKVDVEGKGKTKYRYKTTDKINLRLARK